MIPFRFTAHCVTLGLLLVAFTFVTTRASGQALPSRFAVTWAAGADYPLDRGIGVAYLGLGAGAHPPGSDTMFLRANPSISAPVVGAFLYDEVEKGNAWRYGVAAPTPLTPNVLEHGYEEAGVPMDSFAAGQTWARVILGFNEDEVPYRGWVQLDSARVRHLLWRKVLAGNRIFFLPGEEPRFFGRPGGKEIPLQVRQGDSNYIMHPLESRGPWLRVRVARPADICGAPNDERVRNTVAWIRYLTPRGRPRVWYYTRGC